MTLNNILRVGIIGAGRMGVRHAEAYSKIKGAKLVGIADIKFSRAKKMAKEFQIEAYSVEKLLGNKMVDVIHVCSQTSAHAKNTIDALNSGKHVLVEKPMATSIKECKKMIQTAKKNHLNLMVGQTYRFYPSSIKTKEIIDSGKIGKVMMVLDYGIDPGQLKNRGKVPSWALDSKLGGGVFYDTVHSIDKLRFWLKSDISEVYVPLMNKLHKTSKAEEIGCANLIFKNGIVAVLMPISPSWGIRDTETKIIGEKGALYTTYGEEVKVGRKKWTEYSFKFQSKPAIYDHNIQGFVNEISEFIESIKKSKRPIVSGHDGMKNLQVVIAMYQSFKKKKPIKITN